MREADRPRRQASRQDQRRHIAGCGDFPAKQIDTASKADACRQRDSLAHREASRAGKQHPPPIVSKKRPAGYTNAAAAPKFAELPASSAGSLL